VRTRSILVLLIALAAAARPALSGAEGTRLTGGNVSVIQPAGWRPLTRSELAAAGDPPPLIALVRQDTASFQIVKSPLAQREWTPMQVAGASMPLLLLQFQGAAVETPLHETTLANLPAAEWTATYTISKRGDGRARMICVLNGDSYYAIAASGPAAAQADLDAMVKSLMIGK